MLSHTCEASALSITEIATTLNDEGFNINRKTVDRDIEDISLAYPLSECDSSPRRFYFDGEFKLDFELVFDENQLQTIVLALQTLKQHHDKLLTHYNRTAWAPPPVVDAHAPDAPAQECDDDMLARPLSRPPRNLLASMRVPLDEEDGEVAARPSLTQQRQVTKRIESSKTPNPFLSLSLPPFIPKLMPKSSEHRYPRIESSKTTKTLT